LEPNWLESTERAFLAGPSHASHVESSHTDHDMDAIEFAGASDAKPDSSPDQQAPSSESVPAMFETSSVDPKPKLRRHSSQGANPHFPSAMVPGKVSHLFFIAGRHQYAPEAGLGPQTIVSTVLALTSGLLSFALVRSNRQHKKRYHRIKSEPLCPQFQRALPVFCTHRTMDPLLLSPRGSLLAL
jgi:hypothetical protein